MMGNVSSVREGGGEEGRAGSNHYHQQGKEEGDFQQLMGQSPPHSPRGAAQSPLLCTPQIPMVPLQRFDEIHFLDHGSTQNSVAFEDMFCEQGIPTMITWSYGGKEVVVEGSWDNWKCKQPLQRSGKEFTIMKVLPSGVYQYRFIVDGELRYARDMPWMHDEMGNTFNTLDLQDFVPDDLESIAGFEPPRSPESSYDNWPLGSEDFAKEPPVVPPQLHLPLLNTPSAVDNPSSLSKPRHVVLNHLYIQKAKGGQPVVALGATNRFLSKYVTMVLYKSLQK